MAKTYTATVNGIKMSSESKADLLDMVERASAGATKAAPKAAPKAKKARPTRPEVQQVTTTEPAAKKATKLNETELVKKLTEDFQGGILEILSNALGVEDFPNYIKALHSGINSTYGLAHMNATSAALRSAGIKPTRKSIEEFGELLAAQPANKQEPTFENLQALATEAVAEEWMKADAKAEPKTKAPKGGAKTKTVEPADDDDEGEEEVDLDAAKEKKFPKARKRNAEPDADEEEDISDELEAAIDDAEPEEIAAILEKYQPVE